MSRITYCVYNYTACFEASLLPRLQCLLADRQQQQPVTRAAELLPLVKTLRRILFYVSYAVSLCVCIRIAIGPDQKMFV